MVGVVGNLGLTIAFGIGVTAQFGRYLSGLVTGLISADLVLYDLPPMVLDYRTTGGQRMLRISLQVNDKGDARDLKHQRIRIINNVVGRLRGAHPELQYYVSRSVQRVSSSNRIPAPTRRIPRISTQLVRSRKMNTEAMKVKTSSICPTART